MSNADPSNPLHKASFYIEALKYGPGPRAVETVTAAEITAQLETLLRDADVTSITAAELVKTLDFYAGSFARHFGVNHLLGKSIFTDGVMHGVALAAGLEGEEPS